jgi:anti-sigma B factor antagonist
VEIRGATGRAITEGSMDLVLENRVVGPWSVVRVAGELDLHTSPQLRDHVLSMVGDEPVRLALDLSEVGFMDSSSLGMLVTVLKRVRERDGDLRLVGVTGSPMKVFSLTGLDRVFEITDTAEDLPT